MNTKLLSEKIGALVKVYREQGPLAAQEAFKVATQGAKDWEARALRVGFQSAIVSGAQE